MRQTFVAELVGDADLHNAVALNSTSFNAPSRQGQFHRRDPLCLAAPGPHGDAGHAVPGRDLRPQFPDLHLDHVPTVAEFVPGCETSAWYGVGVPKATPAGIADRIYREVAAGLADANMKARFADLGGAPMPMPSAEFTKLIADETDKVGQGDRRANLKPV